MATLQDKIEEILTKFGYNNLTQSEAVIEIMRAIKECPVDEFTSLSKWCTCKVNHAKGDNFCPLCAKPLSK